MLKNPNGARIIHKYVKTGCYVNEANNICKYDILCIYWLVQHFSQCDIASSLLVPRCHKAGFLFEVKFLKRVYISESIYLFTYVAATDRRRVASQHTFLSETCFKAP